LMKVSAWALRDCSASASGRDLLVFGRGTPPARGGLMASGMNSKTNQTGLNRAPRVIYQYGMCCSHYRAAKPFFSSAEIQIQQSSKARNWPGRSWLTLFSTCEYAKLLGVG
jgi:hypothetical protein